MNGNAAASRDIADNLISRNRAAATGKMHGHIMDSLYGNAGAPVSARSGCSCIVLHLLQNFFVGKMSKMILLIQLNQLIGNLAFLQTTVPDCRKDRIPLPEAVLLQDGIHILRLQKLIFLQTLGPAVVVKRIPAADNVLFLLVLLEPLVDLVLRRSALTDAEPVQTRSPRILRGHDLNAVTVLNLIIDVDELAVDARAHHLVADRRMNGIGKINRRRPRRQVLDLSVRSKTVHAVGEEIQIAL